jgi:hypothetical protein
MTVCFNPSRYRDDPAPASKTGEDFRASIEQDYFLEDGVQIQFHYKRLSAKFIQTIFSTWVNQLPKEEEVFEQIHRSSETSEFAVTLNPFCTIYYLTKSPLTITQDDGATFTYAPEPGCPCIVAYPYSPDMPEDRKQVMSELFKHACQHLSSSPSDYQCVWLNEHPRTIRRNNSVMDLETTFSRL